ncbi:MAG TPA: signal peptidase I [Patescibacteria group bacterium]|jgi:signal peptidase I|nr:signal peptidase I [Patescibacteria group bacterium]
MEDQLQNPPPQNSFFSGFLSSLIFVWDFLKVIIIALAVILPVRYFLFQPFIVSGSSMEPNFSHGQYLIIDELSYRLRAPIRGEVIVLHYPKDRKQFFIKRIVGLPGETVEIDNGRVTVTNAEQKITLEEPYLQNQGLTFPHNTTVVGGKKTITLSSTEYFMLGDNRLASSDSRDWGPLDKKDMVGRVLFRILPLPELARFKAPSYSFSQ